ncbi:MAG: type II toxin-antitoxin system death-on-curing family toxin [Pseudomonadota bacterium]
MPPIRWLSLDSVLMLQELQIQEFGGATGIRDRAMLESALARPQNKEAFGETRISALAAAYCYGFVRNHAFIDGNKRIGLVVAAVFLEMNGLILQAPEDDATATILSLSAGSLTEEALTTWFERHSAPLGDR